jgi:hypothetical protein
MQLVNYKIKGIFYAPLWPPKLQLRRLRPPLCFLWPPKLQRRRLRSLSVSLSFTLRSFKAGGSALRSPLTALRSPLCLFPTVPPSPSSPPSSPRRFRLLDLYSYWIKRSFYQGKLFPLIQWLYFLLQGSTRNK